MPVFEEVAVVPVDVVPVDVVPVDVDPGAAVDEVPLGAGMVLAGWPGGVYVVLPPGTGTRTVLEFVDAVPVGEYENTVYVTHKGPEVNADAG